MDFLVSMDHDPRHEDAILVLCGFSMYFYNSSSMVGIIWFTLLILGSSESFRFTGPKLISDSASCMASNKAWTILMELSLTPFLVRRIFIIVGTLNIVSASCSQRIPLTLGILCGERQEAYGLIIVEDRRFGTAASILPYLPPRLQPGQWVHGRNRVYRCG